MKYFYTILLAILTFTVQAQSDKEKAFELGKEAVQKMDAGNIDEAIKLLDKAQSLDPENINYPYEIAYALFMAEDLKNAIKTMKPLLDHKDVNDHVYQMLGNFYDIDGKRDKAILIYDEGLQKFPKSGGLHLERGNVEAMAENYDAAISYYEKGIAAAPEFPSNYYQAAKLYLNSTEEVWGMIYGELFINLEPNTVRTGEISKMLFDTYKSEINFTSDSSVTVSFCKNATIFVDADDPGSFKLPFGIGVYEPLLLIALVEESQISLSTLDRIRTKFLDNYFRNPGNEIYANALFEYQKQILEAGHFEAYNHWALLGGDEPAFLKWHGSNKEKWDEFIAWYAKHPIGL